MKIERAAVIGSGVMGSGIAAQFANAGIPVLLLDIPAPEGSDRSARARGAVERMSRQDPAPFMHRKAAERITPGNLEDDLHRLADADWIVEAVLEDPRVKRELYARIEAVRKDGSVVSSNTSTIPLAVLTRDLPERFRRDFLITHFFNPPRYMRLLEVVAGPQTRADAVAAVREAADRRLGKGVVMAKDTPGFIANRIGTFWIQSAVNGAFDHGLTVEEADAVMSKPLGIPKTGVFGLIDLVGLDLMPKVSASLLRTLPDDDPYRAIHREPELFARMIAQGLTGRKGKGGFYRLAPDGSGGRVKESISLATGSYAKSEKPSIPTLDAARKDLRRLVATPDKYGRYAAEVLARTLGYAAVLIPAIADDPAAVDEAMRLGYNWSWGPFELIDRVGADWLSTHLAGLGQEVPPLLRRAAEEGRFYRVRDGVMEVLDPSGGYRPVARPEGVLRLADIKRASRPVRRNGSAALWDLGDGVLCLEFTSKMNTLDPEVLAMMRETIALVGDGTGVWRALVIHNEGENFSVGANLGQALFAANIALWPAIEQLVREGQAVYRALKYAPFPVVAAPAGLALGGGCELLLHADAVVAHAETYAGLVEVGVGIIPGWGGCTEMLVRHTLNPKRPGGPMPPIASVFETIATARVAKSAFEARELGMLRDGDEIVMNRDRVLAAAKAKALVLASDYVPPKPAELALPGPSAKAALGFAVDGMAALGKATPHDVVVARELAHVLSGGDTDVTDRVGEDALLALERESFMRLVRHPATIARIEHMLETGKPLRN